MKKYFGLLLLFLILIFSNCKNSEKTSITTIEELGELVFEAIVKNDFEEIKVLMVKIEELENTVDNSELSEDLKTEFKKEMIEKFNSDKDKTINNMESEFENIQENIQSKSCGSNVNLGEIKCSIRYLNNVPFEIGSLEVSYDCEGDIETVNVKVIKTDDGWRLIEKLRLVYKEK